MTTVYLALGANVGDAHANIAQAIQLLGGNLQNIQTAPIYTTRAIGYTDQPDFLNTVITASTVMPPAALLEFTKSVEQKVGRVWRFRWGPREIDIDIIFYGNQVLKQDGLEIPHPRFRERDFVLKPLADLEPGLVDPVTKKTVRKLLEELPDGSNNILQKL